jgi:hypothetical protein
LLVGLWDEFNLVVPARVGFRVPESDASGLRTDALDGKETWVARVGLERRVGGESVASDSTFDSGPRLDLNGWDSGTGGVGFFFC